ncbi:MAG: haloacid dehalogenase-like hydrolase [Colwellia sp.]|nr:haloacid dehalogenase-like hydrolase [Colwellia sp.]
MLKNIKSTKSITLAILVLWQTLFVVAAEQDDLMSSWQNTLTKATIIDFVNRVTDTKHLDYVPLDKRIATFDNDGTLWTEQTLYFQLTFALERLKSIEKDHPEWQHTQPFKGILSGDKKVIASLTEDDLIKIVMATHANISVDEFNQIAKEWLHTAKHPRFNQPYIKLAYLPMIELMSYLRANDFQVYIASAGGLEFMRSVAQDIYAVPPENIIGSDLGTSYELYKGKYQLVRKPSLFFNDDHAGKPVGIHRHIGRRPIAAFGNSDADFEMLEWVSNGDGARLSAIVHHTDAEREWAYDRHSKVVGKLDKALDEAPKRGWLLIDMKEDWKNIYSFEQ